jgi:hypothetical protein
MIVNGVDIGPFVEAELLRRLPGREEHTAESPEALVEAWAKLETAGPPPRSTAWRFRVHGSEGSGSLDLGQRRGHTGRHVRRRTVTA